MDVISWQLRKKEGNLFATNNINIKQVDHLRGYRASAAAVCNVLGSACLSVMQCVCLMCVLCSAACLL